MGSSNRTNTVITQNNTIGRKQSTKRELSITKNFSTCILNATDRVNYPNVKVFIRIPTANCFYTILVVGFIGFRRCYTNDTVGTIALVVFGG